MTVEVWLAFVAATAVLLVIPGPTILAVYLIVLGGRLLRSGVSPGDLAQPDAPVSGWTLFANTYLVTALNPKGIVFFVAFLPQFVRPGVDPTRQLWVLGPTFVVMAAINATLYAAFASSARRVLSSARAQRRLNLAGGSLLTGAGMWALLARRPA